MEDDPANGDVAWRSRSPPEAHGVPKYRLSHPVPFVALEGTSPDVKFGKKTATLTVTFERIDEVACRGSNTSRRTTSCTSDDPTKGRGLRRREIKPGEMILM